MDLCRTGTHASVNVSVVGSCANHLDILITRAVNANVHRQYCVNHLLSKIQSRMNVDALQISSVHLGIIWMKALVSVYLGLTLIDPWYLNTKRNQSDILCIQKLKQLATL